MLRGLEVDLRRDGPEGRGWTNHHRHMRTTRGWPDRDGGTLKARNAIACAAELGTITGLIDVRATDGLAALAQT